jgi:hypothetical protein
VLAIGKSSMASATHSALFTLAIFWKWGLTFCPGQLRPLFSYFTLSAIAGMTGTHHCAQLFSIEMGFCLEP